MKNEIPLLQIQCLESSQQSHHRRYPQWIQQRWKHYPNHPNISVYKAKYTNLIETLYSNLCGQDDVFATTAHRSDLCRCCIHFLKLFNHIYCKFNTTCSGKYLLCCWHRYSVYIVSNSRNATWITCWSYRAITNGTRSGHNGTGNTTWIIMRSQYLCV